jgi:hypothetical protein
MALESFKQFTDIVEDVFQANAFDYQNQFTSRLGGEIAKRTPIDTGLAKGNWQANDWADAVPRAGVEDKTKTGIRAQRKMYKFVSVGKFKNGRSVYIKNAVDAKDNKANKTGESGGYIIKLEEGGSPQAPNGMVYVSIAQSDRISKKALNATVTRT